MFYWHHYQINSITYTWGIKKPGESKAPLLKDLCSGGSPSGFSDVASLKVISCHNLYSATSLHTSGDSWEVEVPALPCPTHWPPLLYFTLNPLRAWTLQASTWNWDLSCPSLVSRINFCFPSLASPSLPHAQWRRHKHHLYPNHNPPIYNKAHCTHSSETPGQLHPRLLGLILLCFIPGAPSCPFRICSRFRSSGLWSELHH